MPKPQQDPCDDPYCRVRTIHLDRVLRAKKEAIADPLLQRLALTYKVLGDPTRLKIVMALDGGEMCVCDLAAFVGVSESAVSHQLRHLKDLALVKSRRDGQMLFYALDDRHVSDIIGIGLAHLTEGGTPGAED